MSRLYSIGKLFFQGIYHIYFGYRAYGAESVPVEGPVILAVNHASFLDPMAVGLSLPREIHYLARKSLFFPPLGWFLRRVNAVPVDRDGGGAKGLKAILGVLNKGAAVLIFPEGTRTTDGNLLPARPGIGLMVLKSSAPVVPVRVYGTFEAYAKGAWFPKPRNIRVVFGQPILFSEIREEAAQSSGKRVKELYDLAASEIMRRLGELRLPEA